MEKRPMPRKRKKGKEKLVTLKNRAYGPSGEKKTSNTLSLEGISIAKVREGGESKLGLNL